ncbi:response regulator [filamentous cyanobacterium LEGE 11480]|uniref:histidine kinase n=1 Tax=Romeriopsis navalis LEGE 11480 TaxID=2777977 RepID=A0A928Z342_9CYAN|nr:ATP-binding protein [Romeriopsis navalis]MBE9028955.1 response regulator [Romeriopsis navalis LEGE 11480]
MISQIEPCACPSQSTMSSHPQATSILTIGLTTDTAALIGTHPDWASLAPPEQTAIQLRLEQSLNQLRQQLDETYLQHLGQMTDIGHDIQTDMLKTFLAQVRQNLGNASFGIVCLSPSQSQQFISPSWASPAIEQIFTDDALHARHALQPSTAWPLTSQSGASPIGWLVLETDTANGWMQSIQQTFIQRAIGQLANVLRSAEIWQQSQAQTQALNQKNQELAQVSKLKSEFLANTSHEIRTPLSSILGFTRLMQEQGFSPDSLRHKEYLRIILTSGQHLLALINDILDLSKIEANQMDLHWSETELEPICKTAITLVKEKANDKGVLLRLDRPEDCDRINADPLRLKQMLFNLLSNAIKFTETGSVGLRLRPDGQYIRFTVWDTGAGITPEQQASLFRAYSQLPQNEDNRSMGTGLGLALTQKLADLHGGWVEVSSTVGEGSEFTIVLPIAAASGIVQPTHQVPVEMRPTPTQPMPPVEPQTVKATIPARKKFRKASRNYHLLLVEDHQPNARLMITYLCKLGYEVTWARDSKTMWKSLEQSMPAMILMDINLPDIDGLTLTKQLREHDKYKDLPIIAQTAMAMTGDKETCLEAGVNDYITKPIDLTKLADTIRQYSDPGIDR